MTNDPKELRETLGLDQGRRVRRWLLVILVLVLAGAGLAAARHFQPPKETGPTYETMEARRGDLVVTVTATGQVEPLNTVQVGTEVSGTVATVEVDYNDSVTRGQVLARLDTARLAAQLAQSRAAVNSARANRAQARAQALVARQRLDRLKEARRLSGGRTPAESEIEQQEAVWRAADAGVAAAEASVEEAGARLEVDETNLSKATILSPIDGIVLERSVEPGQTVAASLQAPILFSLAEDLTKMELNVDVDEADVGRVREGQPAFFTVDAYPGETFSALVTQVRFAAKTESGVVTYATLLSVENQDLKLRPGMTATADIRVQEVTDALLAPNRALRYKPPAPETEENGDLLSRIFPWRRPRAARKTPTHRKGEEEGQTVWILRNNEPVPVKIRLGVTDGDSTQVLSGDLAPGTPLIVEEVKKPS